MRYKNIAMMLIGLLLLAACSGADESTPEPQATNNDVVEEPIAAQQDVEPTSTTIQVATFTPQPVEEEAPEIEPTTEAQAPAPQPTEIPPEPAVAVVAQVDRPDWHFIELTDARSGETFTFADFAGKTVFVEPMATWCSNCLAQLRTVAQVRDQLSEEDYVFIGLSVETYLTAGDLSQYQTNQGFDWRFAVLTEDAVRMLVDVFGRSISNPPSTPHFIIRPDGSYTEVDTGSESADELIQQLTEASGA